MLVNVVVTPYNAIYTPYNDDYMRVILVWRVNGVVGHVNVINKPYDSAVAIDNSLASPRNKSVNRNNRLVLSDNPLGRLLNLENSFCFNGYHRAPLQ
ncbi:MAG TPA: hypothetical protein VKB86_21000 [Pyrinomonadaceae bacterium]|nr:hypothetical protein [Pyrinomonadaceae bacterium]